jgi:hypothetical protein
VLSSGVLASSLTLGPARVEAAAARIRGGGTLRLHFPAEDLGFVYGTPPSEAAPGAAPAAAAAAEGSGAAGAYEPQTTEGARLPYFALRRAWDNRQTSLDVVGDASLPQMTLFIPRVGAGAGRWADAAAAQCEAAGALGLRVVRVGGESWVELRALPHAGVGTQPAVGAAQLQALLVRPDGHIWRRWCMVEDEAAALAAAMADAAAQPR